jgi:hypothetical protein
VAREVTAELAQPDKDRFEPSPVVAATALAGVAPIPVDGAEYPGGKRVAVSLPAICAAPSVLA